MVSDDDMNLILCSSGGGVGGRVGAMAIGAMGWWNATPIEWGGRGENRPYGGCTSRRRRRWPAAAEPESSTRPRPPTALATRNDRLCQ